MVLGGCRDFAGDQPHVMGAVPPSADPHRVAASDWLRSIRNNTRHGPTLSAAVLGMGHDVDDHERRDAGRNALGDSTAHSMIDHVTLLASPGVNRPVRRAIRGGG